MKKRCDAHLCYDVDIYYRFFPYLMKRRCDSELFYKCELDVTEISKFAREWNHTHKDSPFKMRVSSIILAAFVRALALRPALNRFIAGYEYWQRDEISITFVVKKSLNDDAPETSEPIVFDKSAQLEESVEKIENYIKKCLEQEVDTNSDVTINTLFRYLPKWLLRAVVRYYEKKDQKTGCPSWVRNADGLHSSIFVSNLGSIGIKSPSYHHLCEWGTTSLFCTIGQIKRERLTEGDKIVGHKETMEFVFTLDDRICDGVYFAKTVALLQDLFNNPASMLEPLTEKELPHITTEKEFKEKLKEKKRLIKEKKKNKK